MEFLKFSKFKLQLQILISEVRLLRERERSATEQVRLAIQKQKQTEDEGGRKLQELQAELVSSNEQRQKLERQVSYLQNDNTLLENKQKELQGTIQNLLQSREAFINVYEESTCEMRHAIETRDGRLAFLSEKINTQLQLFDTIEKEGFSVKQVMANVQCVVSEKEKVVAELRSKMDRVFAFEKVFIEKIHDLENRLRNDEDELRRKNEIISELQAQLETAKLTSNYHPQLEELQKTLSAKEVVIQNLVSEKKALHFEVGNLGTILKKIQQTVMRMNDEDRRAFSLQLEGLEESEVAEKKEHCRIGDALQCTGGNSSCKVSGTPVAENADFSPHHECNSVSNNFTKNNCNSCVSELPCSPPQSEPAEPQVAANVVNISLDEAKNRKISAYHLDSEGLTTRGETSKDPG